MGRVGILMIGGEEGIRTLGTLSGTHDFQSCLFVHSSTSPRISLFQVDKPYGETTTGCSLFLAPRCLIAPDVLIDRR